MRLLCDELIHTLARALRATLPAGFTGKVTIHVNFHAGTPASATVGFEEGMKLEK